MRTMHTVTDITKTTLRLLVGTGCAMVLAGIVSGCGFTELAKLEASDGFGNNFYGESVSISNDWILVGAPADSSNTAATYLYHFDGSVWTQYKKFSSPGNPGDKFGQSVSITNGVAVIGAPNDGSMGPHAGTAYVYRRHPAPFGGWFWLGDGQLPTPGTATYFGHCVSVSNDVALIGSLTGESVFVFRYNGVAWIQEAEIEHPEGSGLTFGRAVTVSGDMAVIGAYDGSTGVAYVYRFDPDTQEWNTEAKLTAVNGDSGDVFGASVSISGDIVLVGAPYDGTGGAVYVFEKPSGGWVDMAGSLRLLPSHGFEYDYFGSSVSVSGITAVIGARGHDDLGYDSGVAYVFARGPTDWVETTELIGLGVIADDEFGTAVSLSGDTAVIGAPRRYPYDDFPGPAPGAAYVFGPSTSTEQ